MKALRYHAKDLILLFKCWEAENVLRLGSDRIRPAFRVGQRLKAGLHEGTIGVLHCSLVGVSRTAQDEA